MALPARVVKQAQINRIRRIFDESSMVFVAHVGPSSTAESTALKLKLRDLGVSLTNAKNSLARVSVKGTKFHNLEPLFSGPTVLLHSTEEVSDWQIYRLLSTLIDLLFISRKQ